MLLSVVLTAVTVPLADLAGFPLAIATTDKPRMRQKTKARMANLRITKPSRLERSSFSAILWEMGSVQGGCQRSGAPSRSQQRRAVVENDAHRHSFQKGGEAPLGAEALAEQAVRQARQDLGRDAAAQPNAGGGRAEQGHISRHGAIDGAEGFQGAKTDPAAAGGTPSAVGTRSLISATTGKLDSRASAAPSTIQARLGVLTRFSTTGPAMPKQAARMPPATGGSAARKAAITAPSPA